MRLSDDIKVKIQAEFDKWKDFQCSGSRSNGVDHVDQLDAAKKASSFA